MLSCARLDAAGTRLYVSSQNNFLLALRAADGALVWKADVHGVVTGWPALARTLAPAVAAALTRTLAA